MSCKILDKKFFSNVNSISDKEHIKSVLYRKGIKILPLNSKSIVSILSDIDASTQVDHALYIDLLVKYYGLDFSDSVFLYTSMNTKDYKDLYLKKPMSFFDSDGKEQKNSNNDFDINTEYTISEYVKKNIDHLHSLSDCGLNALILEDIKINKTFQFNNNTLLKDCIKENFLKMPIHFMYISHCVNCIEINLKDSTTIRLFPKKDSKYVYLQKILNQEDIDSFVIKSDDSSIDKIDIVLFNFSKNHIMKMIDKLIDNNISFPLMTDHASTLFLNESSESNNIKIVERSKYKHSWIHCKFSLKERLFSLLGDETESLFYILPELKNKLQLRFVNPSGTSGEKKMEYFDIFDCISPSFARDGSTIYVARRLLILNDEEKKQNQSMKVNRRTKGFSKSVLKEVLSRIGEDKVFPIYTHLGYIDIEERKTPYFETENLDQLHKVTFGKDKDRQVWFTKALTLYDYSLILQTVAKRVLRYKDIIFIRKYRDSVINLMLPINKNQLNGLTFYVDSFDKTNIIYNYKKIIDLSYNYEYNTNRKIVTIVGVGNNYPIIEKNYIINAENKNIKIKLDKNLNYDGVSYLKVVSCSRNIKFGLLLKTKLGNYFFGDYDIGKNISDNIIAKSYFKLKNPKKRVEYFSFSELDWIDKESISLPSKDLFEIEILHNAISKYDSILLNELSFIRQSSI